jgi:opine dehydrogenase
MNAGRIGQQQEDFYFYKEGITPEIALIIEKLDQERIQIGRNYDLRLPSYLDSMNRFYDSQFTSYYDFFTQSKVHNQEKLCPSSINERYLLQDVPALLVPWYSLGEQAGYQASTMRSIIDLASLLNNKQHFQEGRDLSRDLFPSLSIKQTIDFVKTGIVHDNSYYLGAA